MRNRNAKTTHRILFLCTGNYYRSRYAEIYFNERSAVLGLCWAAESRGLALNDCNKGPISLHTLACLTSRGIESEACRRLPIQLTEADLVAADHIVAVKQGEHLPLMEANFPAWSDRVEYWNVHDIDCATPAASLPHLELEIDRLIERLVPQRMSA
ncbi:MAG: low molecular weight phosphatase family protein [Pirellulales bacterium]